MLSTLSLEHLCSTCCSAIPHVMLVHFCTIAQTDKGSVIRFALMHLRCCITLQLSGFALSFVLCLKSFCPALQACNSNRRREQSRAAGRECLYALCLRSCDLHVPVDTVSSADIFSYSRPLVVSIFQVVNFYFWSACCLLSALAVGNF